MIDEFEVWVVDPVVDVSLPAREEIVHHCDLVTLLHENIH